MRTTQPDPDPFQMEVARLAGLDPDTVRYGTLDVRIEREDGETVAIVVAEVWKRVDPDELTRLAVKHGRVRPVVDHGRF